MLLRHFLRSLPCFEEMRDEDVDHIAAAMRVDEYEDGHVFVYQDKLAKDLFLVLDGKVESNHYGRSGKPHILRIVQAGEFFGLISLADGHPAVSSCVAKGPVKVASLPFSAFVLLFQPDSEIGCRFQYVIARQLARDLHDRHEALRGLLRQFYKQP
jgi:CRP-like cAMP-binding protein